MKLRCYKTGLILFLMVFNLLYFSAVHAAIDESEYIIEDLKASDIENDDGTGLVLSWKPLPKEKRIIEYRVYRGTTPDSLFYIGKIDVNVKTGVAGDEMYFYDKDFNYFLDIQGKGKLKREKGQPEDGVLFQRYPRDINVTGPQLSNYTILGIIGEDPFFYNNTRVDVEVDSMETETYAGIKLRHLTMLKKLLPNKEYYYTVLPVNESRRYFAYADPVVGLPRENAPEKTKELFPVFVKDINRLQFEWSLPLFKDDIQYHKIYILSKNDLERFKDYTAELEALALNDLAAAADSTVVPLEAKLENPAQLIFRRDSAYPYTSMNNAFIDVVEGKIVDEETGVDAEIDTENLEDYYFVFSLNDYSRYEVFSDPATHTTTVSSALPVIPPFTVIDRDNDKGDYNLVLWGKPVVLLTNCTYMNESKTKLLISYDTVTNKNFKIKNIYFKVTDAEGNHIKTINEFYQDNNFVVRLPKEADPTNTLNVEISLKCNTELGEDYVLSQQLVFDEQSRSLRPNELFVGNEDIQKNSYIVYKKNDGSSTYRMSKKLAGTQREYEDNIRYENKHYPVVNKYDAEKDLFLVSPGFTIAKDEEGTTIRTSLYSSEIEKSIKQYEDEVAKYQAMKDTAKTDDEIAGAESAIEYYQGVVKGYKGNPILDKAAEITNPKSRIKYLQEERHVHKNSYEYFIVKTDGKGNFTQSEVYVNEAGDSYIFPVGNWFKKNMIPALIASLTFGLLVFIMVRKAKKGHNLFIRSIAGIEEIDNAIGRATEMGKPILFVPGLSGISDVATLAGLSILGRVAKKAAEYDTKILVPVRDTLVLPIAQEVVKEAHYEAGRPDTYDKNSAFFITTAQFAFVAGVNGIMIREKTATNFYMGMFWAEALIMTETGSSTGAIQIAGTDAITQIPFFITTCDYTLIGEELYAASAYLAREPLMLGTLKAQDYLKLLIIIFVVLGTALSSFHLTFLINAFPDK